MKINLNSEIDKETINALLDEYKPYYAPLGSLVIAIFLFFVFLLPQIFSFSQKRNVVTNETQKLTELTTAKNLAASEDVVQLSSNLTLATTVLPSTKDFESVINTLSTVATETGVSIQSYQFQNVAPATKSKLSNFPSLVFSVTLSADPKQTMDFIKDLYQKAPVSEVQAITSTDTSSILTAAFFYKPFTPVNENNNIQIKQMSLAQSATLQTISGWNTRLIEVSNPVSSVSASENGSPF